MNQFLSTAGVVVPVFLVIALGYGVGRAHVFDGDRAKTLNVLVIDFALPATLFAGTVATDRQALAAQLPLLLLLALGLIGLEVVVLLVLLLALRRPLAESALLALACTQPQFAFMGIPILGAVIGQRQAEVPIALAGVLVNVVQVPLALVLANTGARRSGGGRDGEAGEGTGVGSALLGAVRQPIVWAPILGILLVLVGVRVPGVITESASLIGGGASGLALLFVGVTVARMGRPRFAPIAVVVALFSVLVQPAATLGIGTALQLGGEATRSAALLVAFPISPVAVLLAQRFEVEADEIASALVFSVVLTLVTLPLLLTWTG